MAYTLDKIASVIDHDTCKAVILCDETPETDTVTIDASDVTGLDGYVDLAAGSRIISPGADFIAFSSPAANGSTTFKKKLSNVGGESSVTVEELEGTVASVFSGYAKFADLATAIDAKGATAYADFDTSALTGAHLTGTLSTDTGDIVFSKGDIDTSAEPTATNLYKGVWDSGTLESFDSSANSYVMDLMSYASAIPATVTIVWHPLPSE